MNALQQLLTTALDSQTEHPVYAKIAVDWSLPHDVGGLTVVLPDGAREVWTMEKLLRTKEQRERRIANERLDPFNLGTWPAAWDELLWEICRLRVRNPGVPIEFLVSGANGSAKTYFAAAVMMWAMVKAPMKDRLFWAYAMDEPNSETVQQAALYYWLPNSYKTEGGAVKTTAKTKLRFNTSGGFTDNRFGLDNGARMECRFWSKAIESLEGPRPSTVWSDEEIPLLWLDGIRRRLLTFAEGTKAHVAEWTALLAQKAADARLPFPRERLPDLMLGVHLVTFTPKSGYTETVQAFVEGGRVMREIDATLLAKTDAKTGEPCGFERVPKLIYSRDPQRAMMFLHAWDNPYGGNWDGMKKMALSKSRAEILWWCYGVAEKIGDSPFPNFNLQVHVRPLSWMPRRGTWFHVVDPVASGGRSWFQLWAMVAGETRGFVQPGDIFVAWEWPKQDWFVRESGYLGAWAEPGGKKGLGVRGPAQQPLGWGYRRQKEEIERVEQHLYTLQFPDDVKNHGTKRITVEERIMDSRAANTEKENESYSKTLIEWLAEDSSPELRDALEFIPAGRDSGASQGQTRVRPGEQMINDRLYYDRAHATLNEQTGWIEVPPALGRGPRLWISEGCTNLIEAMRHYPGCLAGDSAFDDPIDCLRYLIISDPLHVNSANRVAYVRGAPVTSYL